MFRFRILPGLFFLLMLTGRGAGDAQASAQVPQALGTDPSIRVCLLETTLPLTVWVPVHQGVITDGAGNVIMQLASNSITTITATSEAVHLVSKATGHNRVETTASLVGALTLRTGTETGTLNLSTTATGWRDHHGPVEVRSSANGSFSVISTLPMEEYLRAVVPAEIGVEAPAQAQRAQAVAARSFAALALVSRLHGDAGYHVCSTVCCQVYAGPSAGTPRTDDAVRATAGEILTFEARPIPAYYAALCGGHTEDIRVPWPDRASERAYHGAGRFDGPVPPSLDLTGEDGFRQFLESRPAAYCNPTEFQVLEWAGRNFRWSRELTAEEVTRSVARRQDIGRVVEIRPGKRGESGRFTEVTFVGENGELTVGPELKIRRLFQPQLRSAAFTVETSGTAERPTHFIIQGAGSGHGVGMCQTGAMGMANAGKSFRQILAHYYPNAAVEKIY